MNTLPRQLASLSPTPKRCARWLARAVGFALAATVLIGGLVQVPAAHAQILEKQVPVQARGLDVEENIGRDVPAELRFTDSTGKVVRLGDLVAAGKPVALALVYYKCPIVCSVVMQKMADSLRQIDFMAGSEYTVVYVSFDHDETTADAAKAKALWLSEMNLDESSSAASGIHFLTSDVHNVRQLADACGFRYRMIEGSTGDKFSHPVAWFVLTPDGKLSRYFYGYSYPPRDVKLALMEASEGKLVRTIGERLMAFCYMYDPTAGTYTVQAMRVMQVAGLLTMIGLGSLVTLLFVGERVRRARRLEQQLPEQIQDQSTASPNGPGSAPTHVVRVSPGVEGQS